MLVHGGNFGVDVLDFSVNTNPCIKEETMAALMALHGHKALSYPEIDAGSLITAIGDKWQIEPSRLMVGNGAIDCLYRFCGALKPDTALVVEPTFSEYRKALELVKTSVMALSYDLSVEEKVAEQELLNQMSKIRADLIVLCNPNNPTGHAYSDGFVEALIQQQSKHKGYVLIDESFRFFEEIPSYYKKEHWNLAVLTSLTKYYGIPGLRVGYLACNYSLIQGMKDQQMPWNINGVAIGVTKDLLENTALEVATSTWYTEEKAFMLEGLKALDGVKVNPSKANYVLCHIGEFKGSDLNEWLLDGTPSMAIRTCKSFEGLSDNYIRIGIKTHKDNEALLNRLKDYWRTNYE